MNKQTFTFVIDGLMDNGVTEDDFISIVDQLKQIQIDDMDGILISYNLRFISSEQRFLKIATEKGVDSERDRKSGSSFEMVLVFDKELLKEFLINEVGIDEDEDDRGLELAIIDAGIDTAIEDAMAHIITKYE